MARATGLGPFPGFKLSPAPLWLTEGVAEQDVGDRERPGGVGQSDAAGQGGLTLLPFSPASPMGPWKPVEP